MKTQFDSLCALSKVQGTKLTEMLKWLPDHSNLPKQPTEIQSNPLVHVHHWIDAHAETRPEAMALLSSELGKSMTYGELYVSSEEKAKCTLKLYL